MPKHITSSKNTGSLKARYAWQPSALITPISRSEKLLIKDDLDRDFRLPPRRKWNFRSPGMLRNVD